MTAIYLLRHGEADYIPVRERHWPGSMADLAPLTPLGMQQAAEAAGRLAGVGATLLVSSPFTRTMHTASFVASRLDLRLEVEFDLHEWLPDDTFGWQAHAEVLTQFADFVSCGGEWPRGMKNLLHRNPMGLGRLLAHELMGRSPTRRAAGRRSMGKHASTGEAFFQG